MDERLKKYQNCKKAVEEAIEWNNLPHCQNYLDSKMKITKAHCVSPILKRVGQKYQGSNSYWEITPDMSDAILEYIVNDWDEHWPKVLKILQDKRDNALSELQSFVDDVQSEINGLKKNNH